MFLLIILFHVLIVFEKLVGVFKCLKLTRKEAACYLLLQFQNLLKPGNLIYSNI